MTTSLQLRPLIAALCVLVAVAAGVAGVLAMGFVGETLASASSSRLATAEAIRRVIDARC